MKITRVRNGKLKKLQLAKHTKNMKPRTSLHTIQVHAALAKDLVFQTNKTMDKHLMYVQFQQQLTRVSG